MLFFVFYIVLFVNMTPIKGYLYFETIPKKFFFGLSKLNSKDVFTHNKQQVKTSWIRQKIGGGRFYLPIPFSSPSTHPLLHLRSRFQNIITMKTKSCLRTTSPCVLSFFQNWLAYESLPAAMSSESHKLSFINSGTPSAADNYAFCQVRIVVQRSMSKSLHHGF